MELDPHRHGVNQNASVDSPRAEAENTTDTLKDLFAITSSSEKEVKTEQTGRVGGPVEDVRAQDMGNQGDDGDPQGSVTTGRSSVEAMTMRVLLDVHD